MGPWMETLPGAALDYVTSLTSSDYTVDCGHRLWGNDAMGTRQHKT